MCKELVKSFVCGEHMPAIEQFCKDKKCCVSFRRAGAETIERLKLGYPCKGHDVLEKSIKPARADKFESGAALNAADYALLGGLIGHRKEKEPNKGALKGVYVSDKALLECTSKQTGDPDDGFWKEVRKVRTKNDAWKAEAIRDRKSTYKIRRWIDLTVGVRKFLENKSKAAPYFLTGDYDVHDFFKKEAGKFYPCGHDEHMALLGQLNDYLITKVTVPAGLDRRAVVRGGDLKNEFSFIRHGGQIEYCLYMALKEKGVQRVYNVVIADYDVAFCDAQGKWTVCKTSTEDTPSAYAAAKAAYEGWYSAHHVQIKETFDKTNVSAVWRQMERAMKSRTLLALALTFLYKDNEEGTAKDSTGLYFFNQFRSYFGLIASINTVKILKEHVSLEDAKEFLEEVTENEEGGVAFKTLRAAAGQYVFTYLSRHSDEIDALGKL